MENVKWTKNWFYIVFNLRFAVQSTLLLWDCWSIPCGQLYLVTFLLYSLTVTNFFKSLVKISNRWNTIVFLQHYLKNTATGLEKSRYKILANLIIVNRWKTVRAAWPTMATCLWKHRSDFAFSSRGEVTRGGGTLSTIHYSKQRRYEDTTKVSPLSCPNSGSTFIKSRG